MKVYVVLRTYRFVSLTLLLSLWMGVSVPASETEKRLKRLWYIYTVANQELYKKDDGTILNNNDHLLYCLDYFLFLEFGNHDGLHQGISKLVVDYTVEECCVPRSVKLLLQNVRIGGAKFSFFGNTLLVDSPCFYMSNDPSYEAMYSIYDILDVMFTPQEPDVSLWGWATCFGEKKSENVFQGIIKKYEDQNLSFMTVIFHLEYFMISLLSNKDLVVRPFFENPDFKKDIGACMPFFGPFFPTSLEGRDNGLINPDELNRASSFIDEISPDQSSDLIPASRIGLVIFMTKHSFFYEK